MIKRSIIELEYKSNLLDQYQNFSNLPGFILLESADVSRGRYDILSAYPYERCIINDSTPDITSVLNDIKAKLPIIETDYALPFQGGAMGFVSYDLGERLLNIHSKPRPGLEGMPLLDFGLYDWAIIVDHTLQKVDLFLTDKDSTTASLVTSLVRLWNKRPESVESFVITQEFQPLLDKELYNHAFDNIKKALTAGRSYQVNLTQPFTAKYEGNSWSIYRRIREKNPVPFSSFFRSSCGNILSFSPERFLSYSAGQLLTSPIKGTLRRSQNPEEDELLKNRLHQSEKNRAENVMIVDLLRNDLGKIAQAGTVNVSKLLEVQSFKAVHHLVSTIEAKAIKGIHPIDLFLSCFPGGSITGAPKLEAMRIINELEPYSRGVYCGSLGYFSSHGDFDTNIAIRTLTARSNRLYLSAGGGIVIDSECEDEYRECFVKIEAIVNGLK